MSLFCSNQKLACGRDNNQSQNLEEIWLAKIKLGVLLLSLLIWVGVRTLHQTFKSMIVISWTIAPVYFLLQDFNWNRQGSYGIFLSWRPVYIPESVADHWTRENTNCSDLEEEHPTWNTVHWPLDAVYGWNLR